MVIGPHHDDLHGVCLPIHLAQHFLGHLADSIGFETLDCSLEPTRRTLVLRPNSRIVSSRWIAPLTLTSKVKVGFFRIVLRALGSQVKEIIWLYFF